MAFFGFNKKTDQQQTQQAQQGQGEQQADPNQQQPQKKEPEGLDKFATLFQNNENTGNNESADQKKEPINIQELLKDQDFASKLLGNFRSNLQSAISPETKQLMEAGDPNAMQAMMTDMMSAAYLQSLEHSTTLQNLALEDRLNAVTDTTDKVVDSKLQQFQLNQAIPQMNNPIMKMGIEGLVSKLQEQNPTMSPQEVNAQVQEYVSLMNKEFNPDTTQQQNDADSDQDNVDWIEFATGPSDNAES